ncbi:hypothetical protein BH11PLA2_BH11PLA2_19000 [soil metagenome]
MATDGAIVSYIELTFSCLECHQAMRDKKFDVVERPGGAPRQQVVQKAT